MILFGVGCAVGAVNGALPGQAKDYEDFVFVMNIMIPGPPFFVIASYFVLNSSARHILFNSPAAGGDTSEPGASGGGIADMYHRFFNSPIPEDDSFRHTRFKLIPCIVDGNWVVKRGVGSTPALLGTKLRQVRFPTSPHDTAVPTDGPYACVGGSASSQVTDG